MSLVSEDYLCLLLLASLGYSAVTIVSGRKGRLTYLLVLNLIFICYSGALSLLTLGFSLAFNFAVLRQMSMVETPGKMKSLLQLGLVINTAVIFLPKTLKLVAHPLEFLGTSYYSIQQIMLLVDLYQARTMSSRPPQSPAQSLWSYCSFVSFFAQLTAGPISKWSETGARLADPPKPDELQVFRGVLIFVRGLFQKLVVSAIFGLFSGAILKPGANVDLQETLFGVTLGYLSLYFDFSGYSDMAVGSGLLFGVTLPMNFNQPLNATSLSEFWANWHITLTRFIRNYLYFPIVREYGSDSRHSKAVLVCSMALVGIWHGLTLRYLLFGVLHGLGLVFLPWQNPGKRVWARRWSWLLTQGFVVFTMLIFLSPSMQVVFNTLAACTRLSHSGRGAFNGIDGFDKLFCLLGLIYTIAHARSKRNTMQDFGKAMPEGRLWLWLVATASVCLLFINAGMARNFVYADF